MVAIKPLLTLRDGKSQPVRCRTFGRGGDKRSARRERCMVRKACDRKVTARNRACATGIISRKDAIRAAGPKKTRDKKPRLIALSPHCNIWSDWTPKGERGSGIRILGSSSTLVAGDPRCIVLCLRERSRPSDRRAQSRPLYES